MTINNKSERNYRGKCLGWPVTSYGGDFPLALLVSRNFTNCFYVEICHILLRILRCHENILTNFTLLIFNISPAGYTRRAFIRLKNLNNIGFEN